MLLFWLFSFLALSTGEFVQCCHWGPDEYMDFPVIARDGSSSGCESKLLRSLILDLLLPDLNLNAPPIFVHYSYDTNNLRLFLRAFTIIRC